MGTWDNIKRFVSGTGKTQVVLAPWEIKSEDFLSDPLEDYLDPLTGALISDIEDLVPERLRGEVFVGGGFAAYIAGITKEHNDIDIFCVSAAAFDQVAALLPPDHGEIISRDGYGRVIKFKVHEQKFDLVDITPLLTQNLVKSFMFEVQDVLLTFDLNWAMAAITLKDRQLWIHKEALSSSPRINIDHANRCPHGTMDRLKKYRERLIRSVDDEQYKLVQEGVKYLSKQPLDEFDERVAFVEGY